MVAGPTKGTHFVQPLVGDRDTKLGRRSRDRESTRKRFSNININTDQTKPAFLPKENVMINADNRPNWMEKGSKSRLLPKFPRKPGDTNRSIFVMGVV